MTELRQRMLEELQRRNYSKETIRLYLFAVKDFARHFRKSPDLLTQEHMREFQLYLLNERKLTAQTVAGRITALRFFFYGIEPGGGIMPDDLKERLEAFVPPPVSATVTSLEELPAAYDRLSFAKTPSVGQVVDMSALIRRESQLDDHGPGREVHPLVPPELPSSPPPPIR